jgi:hypothetical protein
MRRAAVRGAYCAVATSTVRRAAVHETYCSVATSTGVDLGGCPITTRRPLRKRRKTGRAEVKEQNYDSEEEEWPGRGKGRQKG